MFIPAVCIVILTIDVKNVHIEIKKLKLKKLK